MNEIELSEQEKLERRDRLNQRSAEHIHARADSALRRIFIRSMRIGLPLFALGLIAFLFLAPDTNTKVIEPVIDEERAKQTLERLEMEKPVYRSFDEKQNPYTISADTAIRDTQTPDEVELAKPSASIDLKSGKKLEIEAETGNYTQNNSLLFLEGSVLLKDDEGYTLHTDSLKVDLEEGRAESSTPVRGEGAKGEIESEGLMIEDKGNRIIFDGKSRVILR